MTEQPGRDELEARVQGAFRAADLPGAPSSLRDRLESIPDAPLGRVVGRTGRRGSGRSRTAFGALGIAAVLAIGGALAFVAGSSPPAPHPPAPPSSGPAAEASAAPLPSAEPGRRLTYAIQWSAAVPADPAVAEEVAQVVRARLAQNGATGAIVRIDGPDRLQVDLPAGLDADHLGLLIGRRGVVTFVPLGSEPATEGDVIDASRFPALFGNEAIASATVGADQGGVPTIDIQLDPAGAQLFGSWTEAHIGTYFAIAVDGLAVIVPTIDSAITGGDVQIRLQSRARTAAEFAELVSIIDLEALPVPLIEIGSEIQVDGPIASARPDIEIADDDPRLHCEAPLDVEGPQLGCLAAVRSALAILPADHPPITRISFAHDCNDVRYVAADCAVQMFGIVTISYLDGSRVRIGMSLGGPAQVIPDPFAPSPSATI